MDTNQQSAGDPTLESSQRLIQVLQSQKRSRKKSQRASKKRQHTQNPHSAPQAAAGPHVHKDTSVRGLHYDELEEGECEPSPPRKRHAHLPAGDIHPARAQMIGELFRRPLPEDKDAGVFVEHRTMANTAPMPFNRLDQTNDLATNATGRYEQHTIQQNLYFEAVVNDSTMSDANTLPLAQCDNVGELLHETEQALLQEKAQDTHAGSSWWRPANSVVPARSTEKGPTPPMFVVPGDAADQEAVRTNVSIGRLVAGDNVMEERQTIKEEVVGDIESLIFGDIPEYVSACPAPGLESAAVEGPGSTSDEQGIVIGNHLFG